MIRVLFLFLEGVSVLLFPGGADKMYYLRGSAAKLMASAALYFYHCHPLIARPPTEFLSVEYNSHFYSSPRRFMHSLHPALRLFAMPRSRTIVP